MKVSAASDLTVGGPTSLAAHAFTAGLVDECHSAERVDWALGHAATYDRFADGDVASILAADPAGEHRVADDGHSLQAGTSAWEGFGGQP
jgi:hypothetical protein